jgi:ABC-2 type transport system ATP-binding protein
MHNGKIILERSLSDLQGSVHKLQAAFKTDLPDNIPGMTELHRSHSGKVYTIIVQGDGDESAKRLTEFEPLFVDVLPLTLEEIFVYEMGGEDYGGIF